MLPREREIIRTIAALSKESERNAIGPKAISQRTRIPKSEVEYFCGRLEENGYMIGHRLHGYALTEKAIDLLQYLGATR